MAKWFKEHLGFKSTKPSPPAPPKPDYRHCHPGVPGTPLYHSGAAPGTPLYLTGTQPDILAAYKLQKERDFEDPYIGSAGSFPGGVSSASPEVKYISPKHRLIKVEAAEKGSSGAGSNSAAPAAAVVGVKSPTSPPAEDCKQEKLIILEDYADPFDAKQAGGGQVVQEKVPENDGYMEPYEAQKMMAEIRRRGSKDTPSKPLHLYDTPYEPAENGTDSDTEKSMCQRPRESRLPEDDERPPEEYDQPWEWKKDRISKAFAVQFDGTDKNRLSPSKEEKVRQPHRHSSGNLKTLKLQSMEQHSGAIGERIDPALALENQFWYHGAISRTDAENLLRLCKEASYLVRNSETSKNDYSLSLKSNQGFMHMKLSRTKESKYILGQNSPPFDSVPEIIHYYTSKKLPIKGAEHMSLLYPVAIRIL
ncbi:SH2 domain-containing adapter protein F isoform X2 [Latimeria chalumnae]|uniref:Src homology 2 domain containing F n=1 Tax=Latimeria chalumnae TaxID=7897 RepID=M3XHM6_LATCH|nr:PREDICTED: SH2 domain-containing adapter protein F isoform X3 [Latimeria chalumnae]|eukprot:XP_006001907.1 PREDICTED: SH2 domain-containing adapter protein F isoform X3 [Latimeria chalumnae]